MCGRTVCTLHPAAVCGQCTYKDSSGNPVQPEWREAPTGDTYRPSYNIAPTSFTPVLVCAKALADSAASCEASACKAACERVVQPMRWGMVPAWHSGHDVKAFSFNMSNCRSDSMMTKRSFKTPLQKGRRCVILAEGFYEWKQSTKPKQPYYIRYRGDSSTTEMGLSADTIKEEAGKASSLDKGLSLDIIKEEPDMDSKAAADGVQDGKLMKMAGIFDIWMDLTLGKPWYSFCIITVDGSAAIGHIHDRMPAILKTEEEVTQWLDAEAYSMSDVIPLVRPVKEVEAYPVSTIVNNSRNNLPECIIPLSESKPVQPSAGLMKWFAKANKQQSDCRAVMVKREIQGSEMDEKMDSKRAKNQ